MNSRDTIYALSSGKLPAGIGVVRLSGPLSGFAVELLTGRQADDRLAAPRTIRDRNGEILDRGVVLFFSGPRSFTGEDIAEFHLHGSKASVAAVLSALSQIPGVRAAEAGEFSKRAFLNGKQDLASLEGLADLIEAETDAQRRFALANSSGRQGLLYAAWRDRLVNIRALIEAELDFADEDDVPGSVSDMAWELVEGLQAEIENHLAGFRRAEIILDGFRIVIIGAPNSGKSSLLNALARRDAAIVSDEAGTTRDLIEVALDLGGMKVVLTDTAGIRPDAGTVEKIGIGRALERAADADLVLLLVDMANPVIPEIDRSDRILRVGSKSDLSLGMSDGYDLTISMKRPESLSRLEDRIADIVSSQAVPHGELLPFKARHVGLLRECLDELAEGRMTGFGLEMRAEHLRRAGDGHPGAYGVA